MVKKTMKQKINLLKAFYECLSLKQIEIDLFICLMSVLYS